MPLPFIILKTELKKFVAILILCLVHNLRAQVSLQGVITCAQGKEVLPGATVYFPDLKAGVTSNSEGIYIANNLPKIKTLLQKK